MLSIDDCDGCGDARYVKMYTTVNLLVTENNLVKLQIIVKILALCDWTFCDILF